MRKKFVKKLVTTFLTVMLGATAVFSGMSVQSRAAADNYNYNKDCGSKKGLQVDFNIMSDVEDLGISEAFINIEFEKLFEKDPATASAGSMVDYNYGGTTYHFHKETVDAYDMAVKRLTGMGANVTVAFINNEYDPDHFAHLYYLGAGADASKTAYFAFNTREGSEGQKAVRAVCDFIANRYNGGQYGKINNYIVGNEINDNTTYNNVGKMDVDSYVSVYYQTFKTFYDALRAVNSSAQVYIPLTSQWAGSIVNSDEAYRGKDIIDKFDQLSKADGNIDWNLAFHPYSNPILTANALRDNESAVDAEGKTIGAGDVINDANTAFITMKNINVLTDYFRRAELLTAAGKVRSIILSEQGYSSKSNVGDANTTSQAANIAYAYYKAEMNPYIDAFILYEQVTIADKLNGSNFEFGLWDSDNNNKPTAKKPAYYMYKYIDTDRSAEATQFALNYFGIDSWATVIDGFDISKIYSYGKSVTSGTLYYVKDAFDYGDRWIVTPGSAGDGNGKDASGYDINLSKGESALYDSQGAKAEVSNSLRTAEGVTVIQEKMLGSTWIPEYAVATEFTHADYGNDDGGYQMYHPYGGIATDPKAYYINYQGLKYNLDSSTDMSGTPLLGFEFMAIPKLSTDDSELELRVRVHSGEHVYDANGLIPSGDFYKFAYWGAKSKRFAGTFYVDLSQWAYKSAVDSVEVWLRDTKDTTAFDGFISVQNLMRGTSLGGSAIEAVENVGLQPISCDFNKVTTYCGVDYSKEYDAAKYAAFYPDLAEKGINDPYELIEHYATVGKAEGRIGNYTPQTRENEILMLRLYNPNSGEHFYTGSETELKDLVKAGWTFEGSGWWAPKEGKPVYRLYNKNAGDHHYTNSQEEKDNLIAAGWKYEGVAWNDAGNTGKPLYRLYNPNASAGSHHYTMSTDEKSNLENAGWKYEGIGWYGK